MACLCLRINQQETCCGSMRTCRVSAIAHETYRRVNKPPIEWTSRRGHSFWFWNPIEICTAYWCEIWASYKYSILSEELYVNSAFSVEKSKRRYPTYLYEGQPSRKETSPRTLLGLWCRPYLSGGWTQGQVSFFQPCYPFSHGFLNIHGICLRLLRHPKKPGLGYFYTSKNTQDLCLTWGPVRRSLRNS